MYSMQYFCYIIIWWFIILCYFVDLTHCNYLHCWTHCKIKICKFNIGHIFKFLAGFCISMQHCCFKISLSWWTLKYRQYCQDYMKGVVIPCIFVTVLMCVITGITYLKIEKKCLNCSVFFSDFKTVIFLLTSIIHWYQPLKSQHYHKVPFNAHHF